MKKQILLVDASSLFFRAYYAIPFMMAGKKTKKPIHTNAVYGYLSTVLKILSEFNPQYIIHCFDRPEPTHRVKYYKDYKANRDEMPPDLEEQIPFIHQATDCLGIKRIDKKGFEADDLIGSLAVWAVKNGAEALIISSDKDFAQLVSEDVSLFDPVKNIRYSPEKIFQKWGVRPDQFVDYLALIGDASDNVPGVRGVGPQGAKKLLSDYSSLKDIYQNMEALPAPLSKKLKASRKEALMSQKLCQIVTDLKLVSDFKEIEKSEMSAKNMELLLNQLEFSSIKKRLFSEKPSPAYSAESGSSSSQSILDVYPELKKIKQVEWTLHQLSEELAPYQEVSVFLLEKSIHLFFKKNRVEILSDQFKKLGGILCFKKTKWRGYDLKNLWRRCQAENPIAGGDVMIEGHLLSSRPSVSFEKLAGEELKLTSFNESHGIFYLILLKSIFQNQMEEKNLKFVYENIELKLIPVLYRMEERGILMNTRLLEKEKKNLELNLKEMEFKIFSLAGHPFNISSPRQLAYVLFDEMGLKKGRKTKTGHSTDSDVLQALNHPIAKSLLEYRELFKLKTTYVEGLLSAVNPKTKRVHTSFKQTGTATGRLASLHPNLQNIPIKTKRGRKIRESFVCPPGHCLIGADYAQIELCILAHLSGDERLKQAFIDGEDIHKATAGEIFNTPAQKVTEDQRRMAKTVNFGITYGQGAFTLSESLDVHRSEAQDIIDRYFSRFSRVKEYISDSLQRALQQGYVETLFGRRRMILELFSKNMKVKKGGERMAVNSAIQGTASDLVKMAMIQMDESLWANMLLQVHDELLFECPMDNKEEEMRFIKQRMESVFSLSVPLRVHIASADNWDKACEK